jgi:integrase/recombinase XerD
LQKIAGTRLGHLVESRNKAETDHAGNRPGVADVRVEWERLIGDFEASIQASGLALRTVEHYSDVLRRVLLGFCERAGVPPQDLTKRHLERLAAELLQSGISRQSVKTYLSAVNRFLKWSSDEGELGKLRAPQPSVERKVLDVLTREEIRRIEDAADTERDKLIVRVLADTGIRVGELRRLRTNDLISQGRERYLGVRGKGAKERLVPVTPGLYSRLDRYARRSRPQAGTDLLFVTLVRGRSGDHAPISESSVQHLLSLLGRKAEIGRQVHPHLFRHSLATNLLRRNVNPVQVRDILGHSSLAMIDRVYSHLVASDAHQALMEALRADE